MHHEVYNMKILWTAGMLVIKTLTILIMWALVLCHDSPIYKFG
jgi:hypothetical protein